jgi:hypothetical protein
LAVAVLALVTVAGCSSSAKATADDVTASAEQAERDRLGVLINACALQRVRLQRTEVERGKFARLLRAYQLLNDPLGQGRGGQQHPSDGARDFDVEDITEIRLALDSDGIRVDGRAESLADVVALVSHLDAAFSGELALAEATRSKGQHSSGQHSSGQHSSGQHSSGQHSSGQHSSGQHSSGHPISFRIVDAYRLETPFGGVSFDDELFPPKNGRSLQEYADDLCNFGDDSPPELPERFSNIEVEQLAVTSDGWLQPTLRIKVPTAQVRSLLDDVENYDGVTVRPAQGVAVVDWYRIIPADDFDAKVWLGRLVETPGVPHDHALDAPPDFDELITWREEGEFPVDVPRALLGNVSWYRYLRVHGLYHEIARDYARLTISENLWVRRARALRASLCLTRAYTAPADDMPDSQTRPLHAAKLRFSVPVDAVVPNVSVERIRVGHDGQTTWEFSSPHAPTLEGVHKALKTCMSATDLEMTESHDDQLTRHSGTATAPPTGLFAPQIDATEPPRYDSGRAFVVAVRDTDVRQFTSKLYTYRSKLQRGQNYQALRRLSPPTTEVEPLAREIDELTRVYQVDVESLRHEAVSASGWQNMRPFLVDIKAEARPAELLAFVTQLFDLDRVLVPAEFIITPADDGHRLKLHAKLYAFFDS